MKQNKNHHHFDINFLNQLVEDVNSCVEVQKLQHHLALHPYHLNELNNSIKELLGRGIVRYSSELDGILFGYKNIKLLSEVGKIYDDSCFIHIDIEAEFFIFKPVVGKLLQGIVNKISEDHIGCLVHKIFNVSLPKPENEEEDWLGQSINLRSEILFKVTLTNFDGRLPYIRGEIISILSQPEQSREKSTAEIYVENSKKKKSSKKLHFDDIGEAVASEEPVSPKKSKKSKKSKEIKTEIKDDDEISLPDLNLDDLFSSGCFKVKSESSYQMADSPDKNPRKRKRSSSQHKTSIKAKDIDLSHDSDLENLLGEVEVEIAEKKSKSSRKHKVEKQTEDFETPKKKKKEHKSNTTS